MLIIGTLVSFCVIGNSKEFPITRKRQFPAFAREPPPISLTAIFKIVPTAFCKTNTDFLQIYLQISDPNSDFVRFPLIQFRPVFITSPRKIIPHRSPRCQFPRFQTFSTNTFTTFGLKNAGSVGPRWIFLIPSERSARRTMTAFCSYQAML